MTKQMLKLTQHQHQHYENKTIHAQREDVVHAKAPSNECYNRTPGLLRKSYHSHRATLSGDKSSSTNQSNSNNHDPKSLMRDDVLWQQNQEQVLPTLETPPGGSMESLLSSLFESDQLSTADDFLNCFDMFCPTVKQEQAKTTFSILDGCLHDNKQDKEQNFSTGQGRERKCFDSVSSTSDDSVGSFDSIEENYKMLNTPSQTNQHSFAVQMKDYTHRKQEQDVLSSSTAASTTKSKATRGRTKTRQGVDPIYNSDPYLQRHRLMVNARQKNRMMKLNKMYTTLNSLIPEKVSCRDGNVKPHSKLGILKRAISYWSSLAETLATSPHAPSSPSSSSSSSSLETKNPSVIGTTDLLPQQQQQCNYFNGKRVSEVKLERHSPLNENLL